MRLLLATALALLALAAPAQAGVTGDWGRHAAVAAQFRVPLPDVYVHSATCAATTEAAACATPSTGEAWLPKGSDKFALAHELGHVYDYQVLTDEDREWFRRIMGAPAGDWWAMAEGAGEWFADYYALCAVGRKPRTSDEGYASPPSSRRLARACYAIDVLAIVRSSPSS